MKLYKRLYQSIINKNVVYRENRLVNKFSYRESDVFLISYPKSGSTWLRFILANIIALDINHKKRLRVDFSSVNQLIPALSLDALKNGADYKNIPDPRLMRSHRLYTPNFRNVIYLIRDGRDVITSYYYHYKKFHLNHNLIHK